jgi:hypothetical protein
MQTATYDLAIVYRVSPHLSRSAPSTFKEKFDLVKACFESLKEAARGLNVHLTVLLDNCPAQYWELFDVWNNPGSVVLFNTNMSGSDALKMQIKELLARGSAEIVLVAEDDYLYEPQALKCALEFMARHKDVDFLTLYPHPDMSTTEFHAAFQSEIKRFNEFSFQTTCSTTHTFFARRKALVEFAEVFQSTKPSIPDMSQWLAITKGNLINLKMFKWLFTRPYWTYSILISWNYYWKQILGGRKAKLWAAQQSLATHVCRLSFPA